MAFRNRKRRAGASKHCSGVAEHNVGVSEHGGKGKRGRNDNQVQPARCLKTEEEIAEAWELIMTRRRDWEDDDAKPIRCYKTRDRMYNEWLNDFREFQLNDYQKMKSSNQQASIFRAYLHKNCGGLYFVMAVWQTGLTWLVPEELANNQRGATEHAAREFARWVIKFACAIQKHKASDKTKEAQRKAGQTYGQSGLTRQEVYLKKQREHVRWNFNWAYCTNLRIQYTRAMEQGKSKKGYGKKGKSKKDKDIQPLRYEDLDPKSQELMDQYWSGELLAYKKEVEAAYRGTQADRFQI